MRKCAREVKEALMAVMVIGVGYLLGGSHTQY